MGERNAEVLAMHFAGLEDLLAASREDLEAVDEIGPVIAESVQVFLADASNRSETERLRACLRVKPSKQASGSVSTALAGKSFVLTGTMAEPRAVWEGRIRAVGGKPSASVSKKTDFVVAGENPGSKRDKALELGVPVIGEAELRTLLDG